MMRIALSITDRPAAQVTVDAAVAADRHGADEVWLAEDNTFRGAFTLAGAIAARTTSVRIGIGVVNPRTRHPFLTAMEFGALNELAPGRTVLGLGAGNAHALTEELRLANPMPLAHLVDATRLLRRVLAGSTYEGHYFHATKPLQWPPPEPPPIFWGVKMPRAVEASLTEADGLLLSIGATPPYVAAIRKKTGPTSVLAAYVPVVHHIDAEQARAQVRPVIARILGLQGDNPMVRYSGVDPALARQCRERFIAGELPTDLITDDVIPRFAIAGDLDDCAAGLRQFDQAGLDTIVLRTTAQTPIAETVDVVRQGLTHI